MVKVNFVGQNVQYTDRHIVSRYEFSSTKVIKASSTGGETQYDVGPVSYPMTFKTERKVPKTGIMLVGWGGNNGSTFTSVILANKHKIQWDTKRGVMSPNFYGSLIMSSVTCVGTYTDSDGECKKLCVPLCDMLPFVDPCNVEMDGWDINGLNLADSMKRAEVLDWDLQKKLVPLMVDMKPRPSIYNPTYIARSQGERADNVLSGTLSDMLEQLRADIRDFRHKKSLEKVIVMWTASTEKFTELVDGVHDSPENIMKAISSNMVDSVSPSSLFAIASILEGCSFINGSPQNTLYKGIIEMAERHKVFIAGDDFKTGQTKFKSSLVEFFINSGIKPVSIVSYNHLGNNDGLNLSSPPQFRSKEISKSGVIEEMVEANRVLYKEGEYPDHCIVIKYVPYVGDSKRAMDEFVSEICMNGLSTISIHNTCEDSLLAVTVMLDLFLLTEIFQRISFRIGSQGGEDSFSQFDTVLYPLSVLLKAPLTSKNRPLVNAYSAQRSCVENILRACLGIPPQNHMYILPQQN